MNKIQSKIKALEGSQHYSLIFQTLKGNSVVGDGILPKFKLIQTFIIVVLTFKNEEGPFKNEGKNGHNISPIVSTVELKWLGLIHLGWLELSSWSLKVILCIITPGWLELPLARTNLTGPNPV